MNDNSLEHSFKYIRKYKTSNGKTRYVYADHKYHKNIQRSLRSAKILNRTYNDVFKTLKDVSYNNRRLDIPFHRDIIPSRVIDENAIRPLSNTVRSLKKTLDGLNSVNDVSLNNHSVSYQTKRFMSKQADKAKKIPLVKLFFK